MLSGDDKQVLQGIIPEILFDEPMKDHTWINIGGPASAFARPNNIDELKSVLEWCRSRNKEWCYIGRGSNMLVTDKGINGIVISLERGFTKFGISFTRENDVYVYAEGGVSTATFISYLSEQGLSGLEFMAGVPGTIGGNVMTNAGSKNEMIADKIDEITAIDRNGREMTMKKSSLRFSYRKMNLPKSMAVTRAVFKLSKDTPESVRAKVEENLTKRRASQPYGVKTFGSTFKNPPRKFAGQLIEEAGLKGVRIGGARVSSVHANFIVNENGAKARDVLVLMNLIRQRIKERYGLLLEPEVNVVGEKG